MIYSNIKTPNDRDPKFNLSKLLFEKDHDRSFNGKKLRIEDIPTKGNEIKIVYDR